jgi:hypothetical protein
MWGGLMTEKPEEVDEAVEVATVRTKEAEREFLAKAAEGPAVEQAVKVEHRADDLVTLADEAKESSSGGPDRDGSRP